MEHHRERAVQFGQTDRYVDRAITWIMAALLVIVLLLALSLYLPT